MAPIEVEIARRLDDIVSRHGVTILFAVESGSRAWGFASPDSDYDVRFVYVHRRDEYLTVHPRRDVIETPIEGTAAGELDINGWDLRKALALLAKGNPVLGEWLDSPIVYRELPGCRTEMRALAGRRFRPLTCWHHYRSIAKTNYRGYLLGERVRLKKYFYVLRPLLGCRWIEQHRTAPPMNFHELRRGSALDPVVDAAIHALLAAKAQTAELGEAPRIDALNRFIDAELDRADAPAESPRNPAQGDDDLDAFFRGWLR